MVGHVTGSVSPEWWGTNVNTHLWSLKKKVWTVSCPYFFWVGGDLKKSLKNETMLFLKPDLWFLASMAPP